MAPKLSKDSLQAALAHHRAQATQGNPPASGSKPIGDSSEAASDSQPLIIKRGKKRTPKYIVNVEETSQRQPTPLLIIDTITP